MDLPSEDVINITTVTMPTLADLPSALVDDVCIGTEELPEIFERYGYTPESAEVFRAHPTFKKLISVRSAELDKEGLTHRLRASMVADTTLAELHRRVKDPNTATSVLLDAYKAVTKTGGLEPRNAEVQTGTGFSITFNLGAKPAEQRREAIDVTPGVVRVQAAPLSDAEWEIV